ncbi:MAG: helix-turn-helix transcriptional regulator [Acidobacteriota bacterium]
MKNIGELEHLILLALLRLGDSAYGASIRQEIQTRAGRDVAAGALYTILARLETKGLVSSRTGEPTAQRGGRRKKHYRLEPLGARALGRSHRALRRMAADLEDELATLAEVPQ